MKADVLLVIGGSFSPDHLGPARFDEIRARVDQRAAEALDALDALVAAASPAELSEWRPSALLQLTRPRAPERTLASAKATVAAYQAAERALPSPASEDDRARLDRLQKRRNVIETLIKEWKP